MNNLMLLDQARKGIAFQIDQSPETITITRRATKENGFGKQVEDPVGTPTTTSARVRLSHGNRGVQGDEVWPAGFDRSLGLWLLGFHDLDLRNGDEVVARGRAWRVGAVDPLIKFEGIQGVQAQLYPGGTVAASP